jgi:hypothetical protein
VKEPHGALIITTPAELWNSEVGDFDMNDILPCPATLWHPVTVDDGDLL